MEFKDFPFVSVIIPVKNEEQLISRCLSSVISQNYPKDKFEIIVVDNDSVDNTKNIISRFDGIKILEKSGTIGTVRNYGGKSAKGELLAFLDGDCVPEKDWLKKAIKTNRTSPMTAVVGAIIVVENVNSAPWIERYWIEYLNSKFIDQINYVTTISSFCFIIRKDVMNEVGWFNESLKTCEDSDLGYRITQANYKLVIDKDIKTIHLRNAKTSMQFFRRQLWQGGSNIKNVFYHKITLREAPSIAIPICYLIAFMALIISILLSLKMYIYISFAILFLLPLGISIYSTPKKQILKILGYTYIWFLYLLARGLGILVKL